MEPNGVSSLIFHVSVTLATPGKQAGADADERFTEKLSGNPALLIVTG
ncbi:MAG: hypothetical protein IPP02_07035 [Chitinophagaceae bacterium]|nr:hypothetical protein [Chitinophagaceae bacterium]